MARPLLARAAHLALFTLLCALSTSCTVEISTVIRPDGTGVVSTVMSETTENVDFLRSIPNMQDYLGAWQASLREHGALIDVTRRGGREYTFVQTSFAGSDELGSQGAVPSGIRTWVHSTMSPSALGARYTYRAVVDAASLYEQRLPSDPNAQAEARKLLDAMKLTYSVTLPGTITYSNAQRATGSKLSWDLPMGARTEIMAESELVWEDRVVLAKSGALAAVGICIVATLIVVLSTVARSRK